MLTVLLSMLACATAFFTPPPDLYWQMNPMQHTNLGFYDNPQQMVQMPAPTISHPTTKPVPLPPQILDQLFRSLFSGAGGSAQSQASGNGSASQQPDKGGNAMTNVLPFPFFPFLQNQQPNPVIAINLTTAPAIMIAPRPTTTTTQPTPTTQPQPTTWSPKLKLSEIMLLKKINAEKNGGKNNPTQPGTKGCMFKDKWYAPLTQLERGQVGDWCWGSYCNHDSKIVHWDDHSCSIPPPPTTPPTTTQDPNQYGCVYQGAWFTPGADIENHREYGRCFGSYCDFNSRIQHWNDRCMGTVPPTMPPSGMGGMGGMSGTNGMGGMAGMGGIDGMAGMAGVNGMSGMAGMGGIGGGSGMNLMSLLSKKK